MNHRLTEKTRWQAAPRHRILAETDDSVEEWKVHNKTLNR
jgi:hypothetical protein